MANSLTDGLARLQTMIPLLRPAQVQAGWLQVQLGQLQAAVRAPLAGGAQSVTGRLGVPQPGNFKPPVQGFTAIGRQNRTPHPSPGARLTRNVAERGFRSTQARLRSTSR